MNRMATLAVAPPIQIVGQAPSSVSGAARRSWPRRTHECSSGGPAPLHSNLGKSYLGALMKRFVCRFLASHKWVRLETPGEEAYRCSRCGKRLFGKPVESRFDDPRIGTGAGSGPISPF